MRVLVYEYICGGGMAGRPLAPSLAEQGWAMLASIVSDLVAVEGCLVTTTLDERLVHRPLLIAPAESRHSALEIVPVRSDDDQLFRRLAAAVDWVLPIAPESDGVLWDRTRAIEASGARVLGSDSRAVGLAADKYECERRLVAAGVRTVRSRLVSVASLAADRDRFDYPVVLKPRDGAGSHLTFRCDEPGSLECAVAEWTFDSGPEYGLLQPFVSGEAASVAVLAGGGGPVALLPGLQRISSDGRLQYEGGCIPLSGAHGRRAVALALEAARALPGLRGYVGVDLVLGDDERDDRVIEINPRLTTSYVGLRALAADNLAQRILEAASREPMRPMRWRGGSVCFEPDGRVTWWTPPPSSS